MILKINLHNQLLQSWVWYSPYNEFVHSVCPDCCLWIETPASFHHLSSAWILEDIDAAIVACFVLAINSFIVMHIHWQWASTLVAVIWSDHFYLPTPELPLPTACSDFSHIFVRHSAVFSTQRRKLWISALLLFQNLQKEDLKSRDSFSICSRSCVAAPTSCWAPNPPLAFISFTRFRRSSEASNSFLLLYNSSSTKLGLWIPCWLHILRTSSFACCSWTRIPHTHSTWFGSLPQLSELIIFIAFSISAATLTSTRVVVVYFHSELLVFLRSFSHAIVLFLLPHSRFLLTQHVKRLLESTPTTAAVICSSRGRKCNCTHNRDIGGSDHSNGRS